MVNPKVAAMNTRFFPIFIPPRATKFRFVTIHYITSIHCCTNLKNYYYVFGRWKETFYFVIIHIIVSRSCELVLNNVLGIFSKCLLNYKELLAMNTAFVHL